MSKTGRERLREYCDRHGFKQYELAKMLGLADAHLSQLLSGKRTPGLSIAVRIERETGVPAESWLLSERGRSSKRPKREAALAEVSGKEIHNGRS